MNKYRIGNDYDGPYFTAVKDLGPDANTDVDADDAIVYLASDVDARIDELEQLVDALRAKLYGMYVRAGYSQHEAHEMSESTTLGVGDAN